MSLRVYFKEKDLRNSKGVKGWFKHNREESSADAKHEDWKNFAIDGIRLYYDEKAGAPYIELDQWETRCTQFPWYGMIGDGVLGDEDGLIEYFFIRESIQSDLRAGRYTADATAESPATRIEAVVRRSSGTACIEMTCEHKCSIEDMLSAFQALRSCKTINQLHFTQYDEIK